MYKCYIKFGAIESVLKKIILMSLDIKLKLSYNTIFSLLWYKDVFMFESRERLKNLCKKKDKKILYLRLAIKVQTFK